MIKIKDNKIVKIETLLIENEITSIGIKQQISDLQNSILQMQEAIEILNKELKEVEKLEDNLI